MTVGTFEQPDFEAHTGTEYKTALDNSIMVMARIAGAFAPHEQDTPDMTVRVDAGALWVDGALVEVVAQSTGTITAPSGNPRIDRVVIDAESGAVSVITGSEGAVPAAPAITAGKLPVCQVLLDNSPATTAITNALITDERVGVGAGGSGEAFPVNAVCLGNAVADPAADLGYGTWAALGRLASAPPWTSLLMNFEGSGAVFEDRSRHVHPITAHGGAAQSASQYKFGAKALYCDGVGDYLTAPSHDAFKFSTGDFTVEAWIRMDNVNADYHTVACFGNIGANGWALLWHVAAGELRFYLNATGYNFTWAPSAATWYHVAVTRAGTSLKAFVNGTQIGTTQSSSVDATSTGDLYIGRRSDDDGYLKGYLDDLLIRKGFAAYTANFTPPPAGFPEVYQWLRTA